MGMPQLTAEASLYRGGSYRAGTGGMPSAGVSAQRVILANGCPTGWWCCKYALDPSIKSCVRCGWTLFGHCLETAESTWSPQSVPVYGGLATGVNGHPGAFQKSRWPFRCPPKRVLPP